MRRERFVIPVAIALVGLLTSCASGGPGLDPDDANLPACAGLSAINVDDLDHEPNGTCDLKGVAIAFPDGTTLNAPGFGGVRESAADGKEGSSAFYTLFNLGSLGIVAAQTNPSRTDTQWWGTLSGIESQKEVSGPVVK